MQETQMSKPHKRQPKFFRRDRFKREECDHQNVPRPASLQGQPKCTCKPCPTCGNLIKLLYIDEHSRLCKFKQSELEYLLKTGG